MELIVHDLNEFGDLCRETSGASFYITKKKDGDWQVSFSNLGRTFINKDISEAIRDARKFLIDNRKIVEVETKYTLYGIR